MTSSAVAHFGEFRRPVAAVDQREGRFGFSAVREVVATDGAAVLLDDEPGVMGEAFDLDVGFVSGAGALRVPEQLASTKPLR